MTTETEVKTICVECKHCDDSCGSARVWFCEHPAVRRKTAGKNPVNGEVLYISEKTGNALPILPTPNCEDINKGNCPHYEEKADE